MPTSIFIYEHITAGGLAAGDCDKTPDGSLSSEGAAMLTAICEDFSRVPNLRVHTIQEYPKLIVPRRIAANHLVRDTVEFWDHFRLLASNCDWTLLIAPEFDGILLSLALEVAAVGGRLLGPDAAVIELATDKQALTERLLACGVAAPIGRRIRPGESLPADFPYPAVLKPNDGAGSIGVRRVSGPLDRIEFTSLELRGRPLRLEAFQPGLAASVAVLCGPRQRCVLPACYQRLSDDGRFEYLGGRVPIEPPLARRAELLAAAAVECLPQPRGYLGVDLVLGDAADGSGDVVIEVNPRLTTSYVGLRRLVEKNLAAAMLDLAAGRNVDLSFRRVTVEFDADGEVRVSPPSLEHEQIP